MGIVEDPEPGIASTDAPAGLVGMNDVGVAEGIEEEFLGGLG